MTLVYLAELARFASHDETADFAPEAIRSAFVALMGKNITSIVCRTELFDLKVVLVDQYPQR